MALCFAQPQMQYPGLASMALGAGLANFLAQIRHHGTEPHRAFRLAAATGYGQRPAIRLGQEPPGHKQQLVFLGILADAQLAISERRAIKAPGARALAIKYQTSHRIDTPRNTL
ncbi:hypothetical protein [Glutamicibacter halophytocola]|uniref:Uncharacterized protein n=1 Tax=Glutamicibacter halophytocola TaxID=1933880 RepID=A0AA95BQH5_9MICC|nr:hypothetical protein [Glutamicibacter halophytocola]UUX59351.1 hypothetical protein NUH22_01540 [Glutamicibacter halophytocola]